MVKHYPGWLNEDERQGLLCCVNGLLDAGVLELDHNGARSMQFKKDPTLYKLVGGRIEQLKESLRRCFGLRDHQDADPGYKVWISVMGKGIELPIHEHAFRQGYGDLRVNVLVQAAYEGGKVGYVDREYEMAEGDVWFLDGKKPHWVTKVIHGSRIIVSFGFDVPQEKCDAY